jgi:hypothetical protein
VRARPVELTRELFAPLQDPIDNTARLEIRDRLVAGIGSIAEHGARAEEIVVNLQLLRRARTCPDGLAAPADPFVWKPLFVRRSLGLAIVEACVAGRFRSPVEAAGPVSDQAVAEWRRTGWRTFHWEPWLAALAAGARASVLADAVTWSSSLWSAFDWGGFPRLPQLGGADDQWSCPAAGRVRVKGRSELRVALVDPDARTDGTDSRDQPVGLVSMSSGRPGAGWAAELAFLALAGALRSPSRPVPARVLGLWPDSGAHATVDITVAALTEAVDLVIDTVSAVANARSVQNSARAAAVSGLPAAVRGTSSTTTI